MPSTCLFFTFIWYEIILLFVYKQSKGGILEKTVQHLNDLNQALNGHAQSLQLLKQENQLLKEQVNDYQIDHLRYYYI